MNYYKDALMFGPSGGKVCSTLTELIEFVINLVGDPLVFLPHDQTKQATREVEPHRWWFRGSGSDAYTLDAGLFRTPLNAVRYPRSPNSYGQLEQLIQHEYAQMTRGRFPEVSANPWDRLFEMQHYGLPTRLLDWSFNLGQAIWFALQPPINRQHEPVVWTLNPRLLSKVSLGEAALNDFAYLELHGDRDEMKNWRPSPAKMRPIQPFIRPG